MSTQIVCPLLNRCCDEMLALRSPTRYRIVLSSCAVDAVSIYPAYRKPFDLIHTGKKKRNGAPAQIRTGDPLLRRQMLYPLSYGRVG